MSKRKGRIVDATSEGLAFQFLAAPPLTEEQLRDKYTWKDGDLVIVDEPTVHQLRSHAVADADPNYRHLSSCKIETYSRAVVISARYSSVAARLKEIFPESDGWTHFPRTVARKVGSRAEAESIAEAARVRLERHAGQ